MCGIAGGFAFKTDGKKYLDRIESANDCIKHRGPDGGAVFQDETVALGHRRLSIIDTSAAADQPMYSADGRYVMVFNGEIFNFRELISRYFPDFPFRTSSDTEVMLELFIRKGPDSFRDLRGFFAAAIYDTAKKELFVARDRFGKKPLHIYQNDDVLLFGSELRSLLSFGIPRDLNRDVLPYYFQLNYLPQPLSFVRNVRKIPPGSFLRISATCVEEQSYYDLSVRREAYGEMTYDEARTKLVTLMDDATRLRLISDVPLGSFLSGGIDSSVVVALASRHQKGLKTFSIGYKDNPFFDETHYANLVAKKFGTDHTVFKLGTEDFLEHIDAVLDATDEPFADTSSIPTFILSKRTRQHVTVALSGDGGDEVFAGYNKYRAEWNVMQTSFRNNVVKSMQPLWSVLPKSRNNRVTNLFRQLHRFGEGARLSPQDRYWKWASLLSPGDAQSLMKAGGSSESLPDLFNYQMSGTDLNDVLLADMKLVLTGDMLVKVDMMSMANSLEIRSPFLDQEVVEFAFGLPAAYKIDSRLKKRIVQDAFREILPEELYNRPKMGFDIPMLDWFRKELWGKINDDLLADDFIAEQGLFSPDAIRRLKKKLHSSNPEDSHQTIWALLVFQHWWRKHLA
jgi:asparagine synthase (glutamine-hydrolysing)